MSSVNRSKSDRHAPRHWRLRPLALSLACMGIVPVAAQILPTNPTIAGGTFGANNFATSSLGSGGGQLMTINQTSTRGIVNWQSFSIGALDQVNVVQPSVASVLLNRVTGGTVSLIQGRLTSTLAGSDLAGSGGSIYLINPSGVVFSSGSSVSTGGLVASTLDIAGANETARNATFMEGGSSLTFGAGIGSSDATSTARVMVQDGAVIRVGQGGTVGLIGALVRNEGEINVAQGSVGLASGSKVTLDFQGDGLTRFTVPVDGLMQIDLASVQGTKGATQSETDLNASTTAQVMNGPAAASTNAKSGTLTADGGRVVLVGGSSLAQQVVNQSGVVRAQSLVSRGGEILLQGVSAGDGAASGVATSGTLDASAAVAGVAGGTVTVSGDDVQISGSLKAAGLGSGAGGTVTTEGGLGGGRLVVDAGTVVDAGGGATGQNGRWEVKSRNDLTVTNDVAAYTDVSAVGDKAIGGALGRGTDVSVTSEAMTLNTDLVSWTRSGKGVLIDAGAQIVKGGDRRTTTLAVNSGTHIGVSGSILSDQGGALNVDLNADAFGGALPDTATTGRAGTILLNGATIRTDGGNIRLYGQSDAENGRAIGSLMVTVPSAPVAGPGAGTQPVGAIVLADSTLSTCAVSSGEACGGSGSITMRAQGDTSAGTELGATTLHYSHSGIDMAGGSMTTGAGAITLDGRGGIGASGLSLSSSASSGDAPTLTSGSGTITLVGHSRSLSDTDPTGVYYGYVQGPSAGMGFGAGTGVVLSGAAISTGGSVSITGQGGDVSGLRNDAGLMAVLGGVTDASDTVIGAHFAAGDGTVINGSSIQAGAGQTLSVAGTAGSQGFQVINDDVGTPVITPDTSDAWAVNVAGGRSLAARGGQVSIGDGAGDVRLAATGYNEPLIDVSNDAGAGGAVNVTGRNILVAARSDLPRVIDASGLTGGGSIDLHAVAQADVARSGLAVIESGAVLQANALGSGNGGRITVIGDNAVRAFGSLEARGGSAGGNGGTIETSGGAFDVGGIRVDASAPAGQAGSWLLDPYDVTITHGTASGSLPTNPFDPVGTSVIQDGDINNVLNAGTSVTITTGTGGTDAGNIYFDGGYDTDIGAYRGVLIERNTGTAPVFFRLDAAGSIGNSSSSTWLAPTIRSTTGPMDVIFNAGVNGDSATASINFGGTSTDIATISTQGGNVSMHASSTSYGTVSVSSANIDTGGGQLSLLADGPGYYRGANLNNVVVNTGGGNVTLQAGSPGETLGASVGVAGQIDTGGGAMSMLAYGNDGNAYAYTDTGTQITTQGGAVTIFTGQPGAPSGAVGVNGTQIDTRVGQSDAGAGGALDISSGTVNISGSTLATSTGNIDITAVGDSTGSGYSGVTIGQHLGDDEAYGDISSLSTTSGNVTVRGAVRANPSSSFSAGHGVVITGGSSITSGSGSIALRGSFDGNVYDGTDSGVRLEDGARVITTGGGSIELTGSSSQASPGVSIQAGTSLFTDGDGAAPQVQSSGNLVLRAASDGSVPALVVEAPVSAAGTLNLRPGGMDTALNVFDAVDTPITVGGAVGPGFTVSDALLAQLSAPTLVVGSNAHAGAITVAAPLSTAGALTLQNEGAGSGGIALNAAVTADRLGLLSAGDITQTAAAPIVAQHLLARSTGGSVLLDQAANNVSENTLGGSAAGAFRYQDVDGVRVGALSVTGFDAGANQPQVVSATSMAADTVFVRALSGDLTLDTGVSSTSGVDLVAAARFQNPGGGSISGAPWRIWAYTWEGESRGGMAGSGATPNIYGCPYGNCSVAITPGDNHFIYAVQAPPDVPVPTPVVSFRLPTITGPDLLRELPNTNTYTFDRNIGAPPICFATGPLDGDRAAQGDDLLAREWSRVRSRPNLTSCVDTERKNGCGDF